VTELSYCKCGNRGPYGDVCPHCRGDFAFQRPRKSLHLIGYILAGVFAGLILGVAAVAVLGPSGGFLGWLLGAAGGYLGSRLYNKPGGPL